MQTHGVMTERKLARRAAAEGFVSSAALDYVAPWICFVEECPPARFESIANEVVERRRFAWRTIPCIEPVLRLSDPAGRCYSSVIRATDRLRLTERMCSMSRRFSTNSTFVVSMLVASLAHAQAPEGAGAQDPKRAAEMEAYMKAGALGEQHQTLKQSLVGDWEVVAKWWAAPGAPPAESKGSAKYAAVLSDRFVQQSYRGDMMGQSFEGLGMVGYDNLKKKYVMTWADSMMTSLYYSEGTPDKSGKVITFTGESIDPLTGKKKKTRDVLRIESDAKHVYEMYEHAKGKDFKTLELTYTKK